MVLSQGLSWGCGQAVCWGYIHHFLYSWLCYIMFNRSSLSSLLLFEFKFSVPFVIKVSSTSVWLECFVLTCSPREAGPLVEIIPMFHWSGKSPDSGPVVRLGHRDPSKPLGCYQCQLGRASSDGTQKQNTQFWYLLRDGHKCVQKSLRPLVKMQILVP